MQDLDFRTFAEYVDVVGRNAPQALVLDWWRRLDLALLDYFQSAGKMRPRSRNEEEKRIAEDRELGPEVVSVLSQLRRTRNAVAHEQVTLAAAEATAFAEAALQIIGKLTFAHGSLDGHGSILVGVIGATNRPNTAVQFLRDFGERFALGA